MSDRNAGGRSVLTRKRALYECRREFRGALKFLVDLEVRETALVDLKTVSEKQDEIYKLIESLRSK